MAMLPGIIRRYAPLLALLALALLLLVPPAAAQTTDYDADDDGLIDVANAAQLSAIRHDLNGNGDATHADYIAAFPGRATGAGNWMGCPSGTCAGYELTQPITLTGNWTPIGGLYTGQFNGRGFPISGLTVAVSSTAAGLFAYLGNGAAVRNVALISPSVRSTVFGGRIGALAGVVEQGASIYTSYVSGGAVTLDGGSIQGGGLVGRNDGAIHASYSTATANTTNDSANIHIGALVGHNRRLIRASWSAGVVEGGAGSGRRVGRFVGRVVNSSSVTLTDNYCDSSIAGPANCIGDGATAQRVVTARTTAQLQNPTTYTGIYANWNLDLSVPADSVLDDPWYFGATYEYPQASWLAPTTPAVDYDADDDDLIDVGSLAQLHAIRHDLDGDGDPGVGEDDPYLAGFPGRETAAGRMGCPNTCAGYELTADLAFPAAGALSSWTPIAGDFTAIFDGRGHSISGLSITASSGHAGLFGTLGASGVIRNVGLLRPMVASSGAAQNTGALAGRILAGANIDTSYVRGGRITVSGAAARGGGLAGLSNGRIRASYSTAAIEHSGNPNSLSLGGLVGYHASAEIIASYAAGLITAGTGNNLNAGGLVGASEGQSDTITDSHCDGEILVGANCIGAHVSGSTAGAFAVSSAALRRPTDYEGILYANWNIDLSDPADGVGDDPWDFGTAKNYPLLKIDRDGDGRATCREFRGQPCYRAPTPPPYHPAHDHPEIYQNPRHEMSVSCEVRTIGAGDAAKSTSTLTFDLGDYTRPLTLALSLWDGTHFRSLQSQNISMPELRQEGQTATVEVVTDPAQTRFRLDSQYGLNLVLGYADCRTDDPE